MINPESINEIKLEETYENNGMTILDVGKLQRFENEPFDITDDKEFKKYMSEIERDVRTSFEYRLLISTLKNKKGMNKCSVWDVTSADNPKIKIEIHHYPLTLFDLCMTVLKKRQHNGESLKTEAIAEEVMWCHFAGMVGLTPLCSTVHAMFHNNYLFIDPNKVYGNYRAFINAYYNYIDPDILDAVDIAEQIAEEGSRFRNQMDIFNNHKIYINSNGSFMIPRKDEFKQLIKQRISNIKNGNQLQNICEVVK